MGFQIVNLANNAQVLSPYPLYYDTALGNYTYDVKFNASGTEMYVVSQSDNAIVTIYTLSTPWDISTSTYDSTEYLSAGEYFARGISFNNDGTSLYVGGYDSGIYFNVQQYSLSTPYDITTARPEYGIRLDGSEGHLEDIAFKTDGTKLYVLSGTSGYNKVFQYTLSTAWDVSTATYDSVSITATETYPLGLCFKSDGTKMYTSGEGNYVYEYDLSVAWDVSTAVYTTGHRKADNILSQPNLEGIVFSSNGLNLYVQGSYAVTWYTLSTAWTVTTATYQGYINITYIGGMDYATGITIDPTGYYLFIITEWPAVPRIIRLEMSTQYDITTAVYNGIDFNYQLLTEQTTCIDFNYNFDRFIAISEYGGTVSQLDMLAEGDIGTIDGNSQYEYKVGKIETYEYNTASFVSPDGNHAYVCDTYWGNIYQWDLATAYDLTTAQFVSLITMPKSGAIVLSASGTKLYLIDYTYWSIIYEWTLNTAWNLNSIDYTSIKTYDYTAQTTFAYSITFSSDGYYMYIVDGLTQYQYTMSTAWDLSTISYTRSKALSYSAVSIAFKSDGTKLYAGNSVGTIHQYTLATPWNLSTVTYDSVSYAYTGHPDSMQFSSDGTELYIFNGDIDSIELHTLGTAWDLSTASSGSDTLNPALQNIHTNAVSYGAAGNKMYVTNYYYATLRQFSLTTAYDISTATYDYIERSDIDGSLQSVGFNSIGTVMYTNVSSGWQKWLLSTPWNISTATFDSDILTDYSPSSINIEISENNLYLYDVDSGGTVYQYLLPTDPSQIIDIPPANELLATVGLLYTPSTPRLKIFDSSWSSFADPSYQPTGSGLTCRFSPDNSLLAVGFNASPYLKIYDTSDWSTITGPDGTGLGIVTSVAWNTGGTLLAVGHSIDPYFTIYDTSDWSVENYWQTVTTAYQVRGCAFAPHNELVAMALSGPPYLLVFRPFHWSNPQPIGDGLTGHFPTNNGWAVDFSHNGNWLAVAHQDAPYISIYHTFDWINDFVSVDTNPGNTGTCVAFSPDDSILAVGSYNGVFLYTTSSGSTWTRIVHSFSSTIGGFVYSVAWSKDGRFFAVGSAYGASPPYNTTTIYDATTFDYITSLPTNGPSYGLDFNF